MVSTQFFTKTTSNLDRYKSNFIKAIKLGHEYNIFNKNTYIFMLDYISKQTSYIDRSDVRDLQKNILLILELNNLNILLEKIKLIEENKKTNLLQYSFEIISVIENYTFELKEELAKIKAKKDKKNKKNILLKNELIEKKSDENKIDMLLGRL